MPAHLIAIRGPRAGQAFVLGDRAITFGRTPENTIVLEDSLASRRHAEVRADANGAAVYDLGSSNGTRVNGDRVQSQRLRPGDVIELANEAFRFEPGLPPPPPGAAPSAVLVAVRGPLAGQKFPFVNGLIAFGRTPENNIVLTSGLASRRHAELRLEPSGCVLRDLGSSNGTSVNGQRVQGVTVRPGDVIEIGEEAFRLDAPLTSAPRLPPTVASDLGSFPLPAPVPVPAPAASPYRPTALPGTHAPVTPPGPGAYQQPTALPPGPPRGVAVAPPAPAVAPAGWRPPPPGAGAAPPPPPPGDPALAGLTLNLQCPTCKRSVDARYQDCPWDGTALVNGRTVW